MMTVLVIIGLMSSAVILTIPPNKTAIEMQSQTLLRGLNSMAEASLFTGTPTALGLSEDGFALMAFTDGEWQTQQEYKFAPGISPEFTGEATAVKLSDKLVPLALFEPNGLSTPFTLKLSDGQSTARLESSGDGRVVLGRKS